jgi:hypothetical protein
VKTFDVEHIPLDQIDKNPFNPRERGSDQDIKALKDSITESGLYYPILVNRTDGGRYEIIEGHRRYSVYEVKKERNPEYARIPALVIEVSKEYTAGIFRELNETSKKLNGNQWLEISAHGGRPKDLPPRLAPAIKALNELFSSADLLKLSQRMAPSVYGFARNIARFCEYDPDNSEILRKIIAWLFNSGDRSNVRAAINDGNAERVRKAIESKTRLTGVAYPDGELFIANAPQRLPRVA